MGITRQRSPSFTFHCYVRNYSDCDVSDELNVPLKTKPLPPQGSEDSTYNFYQDRSGQLNVSGLLLLESLVEQTRRQSHF